MPYPNQLDETWIGCGCGEGYSVSGWVCGPHVPPVNPDRGRSRPNVWHESCEAPVVSVNPIPADVAYTPTGDPFFTPPNEPGHTTQNGAPEIVNRFTSSIVAGQQSYEVTFIPSLTNPPSVIIATANLAEDNGDMLFASVDLSTVTGSGCTVWLSGIPSSSEGTITGIAFV